MLHNRRPSLRNARHFRSRPSVRWRCLRFHSNLLQGPRILGSRVRRRNILVLELGLTANDSLTADAHALSLLHLEFLSDVLFAGRGPKMECTLELCSCSLARINQTREGCSSPRRSLDIAHKILASGALINGVWHSERDQFVSRDHGSGPWFRVMGTSRWAATRASTRRSSWPKAAT